MISEIQAETCREFRVHPRDMFSARRARAVARPRQVAMYLARHLTLQSLPEIGKAFGNRDHTTVMHAIRRVADLMAEDELFALRVTSLRDRIDSPRAGGALLK